MTVSLALLLLILALVDSLNPSIFLITLHLLSTMQPVERTAAFISGVFLTNWTLGLLVYFGLGGALAAIFRTVFHAPPAWVWGIQLAAAIALLVSAAMMRPDREASPNRTPKSINPAATFSLGVGLTFVEMSTAAPYLGAIAALAKAAPPALVAFAALGLYSVVYVGVPLALLGIYVVKRDRAQPLLARLNPLVRRWTRRVLRVAFAVLGLALLADFVGYLFGRPLLVLR